MLWKSFKQYCLRDEGVAAVEFALLSPTLVMLLLGAIDVGLYVNEKMKAESSARASVEFILNNGSEETLVDDVLSQYYQGSGTDTSWQSTVSIETQEVCECQNEQVISCTSYCPATGDFRRRYIEAQVTKQYATIFPYPGLPSSIAIPGHARLQRD